jgi:hypothetical protein
MNENIAHQLIEAELSRIRRLPYSELAARIGTNETREVVGEDGETYQLEVDVFWDTPRKPGDVRVIAAADDGGWSAFKPLTHALIMRPDGTFVGE